MEGRYVRTVSLGFSPCPNDTFIFYALVHRKIAIEGLTFRERLEDVETLNRLAFSNAVDVTKVSFHAFGLVRNHYALLRSGGALGRGCGPLLVSKRAIPLDDLRSRRIAIPGVYTTAYLLLRLYEPGATDIVVMPFHAIMRSVENGTADVGLIIHEGRFTYRERGLQEVLDLGAWWEQTTGQPIPLGGIIIKRTLCPALARILEEQIRRSVHYARTHPEEVSGYVRSFAQEMEETVLRRHIDLYVNEYTLDIGSDGERAIRALLAEAERKGIIPRSDNDIF